MKTCKYCNQDIGEESNHCALVSYSKGEISNQDNFHAGCWISWLEGKMNNKVEEYAEKFKDATLKQLGQEEG